MSTGQPASEPWAWPAAWVLDHALQLESFKFTPSTHYICVRIQVIITFMYTFKLFSTPALLYTRPCTPLPALLYTKYLRCKGTSSTIYYTHIQVILHALHSFTHLLPRGPASAHHALHSFTPSTRGVKAIHSPGACGVRPYYLCALHNIICTNRM